jgi:hypothetical protein
MIRYYLAKGDKAGNAVIVEGLSSTVYQGEDGRTVELATVYMQTYCHTCNKTGFISPSGPRLAGTAPNGQPPALSGDVNMCDCKPAPVFLAVRHMQQTITDADIERMNASFAHSGSQSKNDSDASHWVAFALCGQGNYQQLRCAAHFEDGSVEYGVLDLNNAVRFDRRNNNACSRIELLCHDATKSSKPIAESLLSAIQGNHQKDLDDSWWRKAFAWLNS